jgi:DNA topoisomerase-2
MDTNMNKAFHSKFADKRKKWLFEYDPEKGDDRNQEGTCKMDYSKFIDNELITFSIDDCKRSLPHVIDGFKESHRKIMYACFLKFKLTNNKEIKVAQLSGFTAEHSAYHHGEDNLLDTIIKLAQDYPGSNNIPFLYKGGQFGSRNSNGKDAASGRYIFTKLENITRFLFPKDDDILLDRVVDDGDIVEPKFYIPILPTILINGCTAGIGTGYSCSIPCFNPFDVLECVKVWIKNKGNVLVDEEYIFPKIVPWYNDFTGTIEKIEEKKYVTTGKYNRNGGKVTVTELPIGYWTDNFKEYLEDLLEKKMIKSMKNYSNPKKVHFEITEHDNGIKCNEENLKLKTTLCTSNMVFFDSTGRIRKYDSIGEILEDFCVVRYNQYIKRKVYLLKDLKNQLKYLKNKRKFLKEVMADELVLKERDEGEIISEMEKKGYDKKTDDEDISKGTYNYLLHMQIRSFTKQKVEALEKEIRDIEEKIKRIEAITEYKMWLNDLDLFEKEYKKWLSKKK